MALLLVSGCETLNPVTFGIGLVSLAATGKGLADHAMSKLTQKDCNIIGGLFSAQRKICEPLGSAGAQHGFKGFFAQAPADTDDEGTTLRFSESIVVQTGNFAPSSVEPTILAGPGLRLSDTLEYSEEEPSRTPDRLANVHSNVTQRQI